VQLEDIWLRDGGKINKEFEVASMARPVRLGKAGG
jgi:hypothetical protein